MLLIPIIYLIVFKYIPMVGVQIAFRYYTPRNGMWGSEWAGFAQFQKFFESYQFERVLGNTVYLSLYSIIAGFPLPIIFALLLNSLRSKKFCSFVQNITYMPHFISTVVMVGMLMQVFNPRIGIFAQLYKMFASTGAVPDLMASPSAFPHLYIWSGIWQGTGWSTVIYMAALSSVDPEQHEAATIDGASRFQRLLHIDFPAIIPTISITLILRCGSIMNIGFDKVFLMQNDLNLRASEVISTYVYKVGLSAAGGDFSYATAIGLFNSIVNLIIVVLVNKISNKVSDSGLW